MANFIFDLSVMCKYQYFQAGPVNMSKRILILIELSNL